MIRQSVRLIVCVVILSVQATMVMANANGAIYPAALFDFSEKGRELKGMGSKISSIIFSQLVVDPEISLVDREEMDKISDELELSLSGMVNTQQANQIGQLTGARILITGTVFDVEDQLMIVAKIIGTETSRVLGASVKGNNTDSLVELSEKIAVQIAETIKSRSGTLLAKPLSDEERVTNLKHSISSAEKPTLMVAIEEHHINRPSVDPAAETEMILLAKQVGFDVLDKESAKATRADIQILGEGFSQRTTRKGNIVGVKARLEVRAVDKASGKVLAIERQTEIELGLAENIAAKTALQKASAKIAARLLPKLVSR